MAIRVRFPLRECREQKLNCGIERREPIGIVEKTRDVRCQQFAVERA